MKFENVALGEFLVAGISVRTYNLNGQSQKDITELWNRFMNEKISEKIPDKVNENIHCIYAEYESDFMGPYTTILGYKVNSAENLPDGIVVKTISPSNYLLFKSTGKLPHCVLQTWQTVWDAAIKRSYRADFDVYPSDAFSSENPVVETYVSIG
jgi:predicted transcriptional regulator YdeE